MSVDFSRFRRTRAQLVIDSHFRHRSASSELCEICQGHSVTAKYRAGACCQRRLGVRVLVSAARGSPFSTLFFIPHSRTFQPEFLPRSRSSRAVEGDTLLGPASGLFSRTGIFFFLFQRILPVSLRFDFISKFSVTIVFANDRVGVRTGSELFGLPSDVHTEITSRMFI